MMIFSVVSGGNPDDVYEAMHVHVVKTFSRIFYFD